MMNTQIKAILKNPFLIFVLKIAGVFLLLHSIYTYILIPHTAIDSALIQLIIHQGEYFLRFLGYELIPKNSMYTFHMGIKDTSGVIIGGPCDGLSLFILFSSFILVFKGKFWFKIIYTCFGVLLIHLLNVIRVVALACIVKYYPEYLDFHHSYSFTLAMYLFIFGLWVIRVKIYKNQNI